LLFQRFIEIWGSMPELYLLIIFSAVFAPSVALLLILLSLFGWMGLSDYVRAEFLRNRQMDYVRAARALGVGNLHIIWRHILPNSLTPVVTFLPFRMSGAILALTSLDFLGLGVPPGTPSLGELLSQGKNSIDAWWISLSTFAVLVITLLLAHLYGRRLARCAGSEEGRLMTPPLLDVQNLRISFAGKSVVHGIDFSIAPGEKLALVGESGSGKTVTALSLLRLAQNATVSGKAVFTGVNAAERTASGSPPPGACGFAVLAGAILARDTGPRHRHDLSGADDGAEPLVQRGQPDRRSYTAKTGPSPSGVLAGSYQIASRHGYHRARKAGQFFPAPALGRAAAAGHDRHGAGLPAQAAAGR
jgi:hypothetical protein